MTIFLNNNRHILWVFSVISFVILSLILLLTPLSAIADTVWSEPLLLYSSEYNVTNPLIISDTSGRIHVFWIEYSDEEVLPAVFHRQFDEYGWNEPTSVLTPPDQKSLNGFEVAADIYGRLHAIWHGQNNTMYYSQVESSYAHDPSEWSDPKVLVDGFIHAGITTEGEKVHIAYPGTETQGVYYIASEDGGMSWSTLTNVSIPSTSNSAPDFVQIAVQNSIIHVVWSEFRYPDGYPAMGVFYSRSTNGGVSWSEPTRMAGEGYDQISVKTDPGGGVHVAWNGIIGLGGRYYRSSIDGGDTWLDVEEVIPAGMGGTSGYPQIDFDSDYKLHFVTTIDWQGGIQYAFLEENKWYHMADISSAIDYEAYELQSLELPRMTISHGNRLHLVYEVGFKEIYYQAAQSGAKAMEPPGVEMLPTIQETVSPEITIEAVALTVPESTLIPYAKQVTKITSNPSLPILIGAGVAVACVLLIALLYKRGRRD